MLFVTTKTGDKGESGLANGERVSKADQVFDVIGTLDELNSWLGLVAVALDSNFDDQKKVIFKIQHTLFDVGAEVARSPKTKVTVKQLNALEKVAADLQSTMKDEWHTKFLLPGGTEAAARIDVARTVCRRCERLLVQYHTKHELSPLLLKYVNRLSDFLYILRCHVNARNSYQEHQYKSHPTAESSTDA